MNIRKRKTKGKPLLVATASLGMAVSGCNGKVGPEVSGNLMPPPFLELCIEVEPETAAVTVEGENVPDGQCTQVYSSTVLVEATAEGYEEYSEEVSVEEGTNTHTIDMIPLVESDEN